MRSLVVRSTYVLVSWVASAGVVAYASCSVNPFLVVGILLLVFLFGIPSVLMMQKTRREEVVGVKEPPFWGPKSLEGKFVVVTGANNGIGKETTLQLAAQGATIAMLCRNPLRAEKAMEDIKETQAVLHQKDPVRYPRPRISEDQLVFVPLDLTDCASVSRAVGAIGQLLESRSSRDGPCRVDSLVCNAGTSPVFLKAKRKAVWFFVRWFSWWCRRGLFVRSLVRSSLVFVSFMSFSLRVF